MNAKIIQPLFHDKTKVTYDEMLEYINPKKGPFALDFLLRNRTNMHQIILNLADDDLQWLFSPIHIRKVFEQFVKKHK